MTISIQDIIDVLTNPAIYLENTVDNMLFGHSASAVTGVGVTFLATQNVIEKAKNLGVNLIISHEGIFYSHRGDETVLQADPVYRKKRQTIEESGIAIYRYHDSIHRFKPDGITSGLVRTLGWQDYVVETLQTSSVIEIPLTTVRDVVVHVKKCLGIEHIRFGGDLSMSCRRIGVFVGYRGSGELVIPLFNMKNLDMVIYGEGPEWETPEYIRDAVYQGKKKALIVLGHGESEMPGMEYLAQWLQKNFPDVPVHFIPEGPVFQIC